MESDRNFLFGVLALQRKAVTQDHFLEACSVWFAQPEGTLAQILLERGWISEQERNTVDSLVDNKLSAESSQPHVTHYEPATELTRKSPVPTPEPGHASTILVIRKAETQSDAEVIPTLHTEHQYTRNRLHAEGGIGRIWLARDESLGRDVALKELLPGRVENKVIRSRFLNEARITSQLEHPGVVPIYEIGTEPGTNLPFYTMRFVHGRTLQQAITTYHRQRRDGQAGLLQFNELLLAFFAVCNAVAYAHSRGVIHRDLKPPNIVMGDFGEVMVLDWGLAKLVNQAEESTTEVVALSENPDHTQAGEVLGTPCYMAPEQASARRDLEDPRTDIYVLGAVLYELLSGKPPFASNKSSEVLNKVRSEPPLPPRQVAPHVPRELEAICLKAMARDRDNRYGTVKDLATDVQHYLADEPIAAYREPLLARTNRWMRRHKTLVAVVAALIMTGAVASSAGLILISRKNVEIAARQIDAERAREKEAEQRQQADANLKQAREAVETFLTRVSDQQLRQVPMMEKARRELLEKAVTLYKGFLKQSTDDPAVRLDLAMTQTRLGHLFSQLGDEQQALKAYEQATLLLEGLITDFPSEPRYLHELASSKENAARSDKVAAASKRQICTEVLALRKKLVAEHPEQNEFGRGLAETLALEARLQIVAGEFDQAIDNLNRAHDQLTTLVARDEHSRENHKSLAECKRVLGGLLSDKGKKELAEKYLKEAIELWRKLAKQEPDQLDNLINLASAQRVLAVLLVRTGRALLAEPYFVDGLRTREQLAASFPLFPDYQRDLANAHSDVSVFYAQRGDLAKAEPSQRRATELYADQIKKFPNSTDYRRRQAIALTNLARMTGDLGNPDKAEPMLRESLKHRQWTYDRSPEVPDSAWELGQGYTALGNFLIQQDQNAEAEALLRQGIKFGQKAVEKSPLPDYTHKLAQSHYQLGSLLTKLDRYAEADKELELAQKPWEKLSKEQPTVGQYRRFLALDLDARGHLRFDQDQFADARSYFERGLAEWNYLVKNQPAFAEFQEGRAGCLDQLGRAHFKLSQLRMALSGRKSCFSRRLAGSRSRLWSARLHRLRRF
ncbi:hypothetical protein BH10PLA2_BH10PLA2_09570 [soil metagenome]